MEYNFDPVKGNVLCEGKDVTIFTTGIITSQVVKAVEELKESGVDAELIEICSIKPIDEKLTKTKLDQWISVKS